MKKIIVILAMLFSFTMFVYADSSEENRSYFVKDYIVDLEILKDGEVNVEETLTYSFDGSFNGVYRDIVYNTNTRDNGIMPGSAIYSPKDVTISSVSIKDGDVFKEATNTANGYKDKRYFVTNENGAKKIKLYMVAEDEEKTVKIKYSYKDAIVSHSDVSELYGNFFAYDASVKHATLNIKTEDNSKIKVYPHTTGKNLVVNNTNGVCQIKVDEVGKKDLFDVRIVMPHDVSYNANKLYKEAKSDEIQKVEGQLAKEVNNNKFKTNLMLGILVITAVFLFAMYKVYLKGFVTYEKEIEPLFKDKYFSGIPNKDRKAAEAKYLITNLTGITNQDIVAILFDLINKKYLKLEHHKVLNKKGDAEYDYNITKTGKVEGLAEYEKKVIEFFFKGQGETCNLKSRIKKIENSEQDYKDITRIIALANSHSEATFKEKVKVKFSDVFPKVMNLMWLIIIASAILIFITPKNSLLLYNFDVSALLSVAFSSYMIGFIGIFVGIVIGFICAKTHANSDKNTIFFVTNVSLITVITIIATSIGALEAAKITSYYFIINVIIGNVIGLLVSILTSERVKAEYVEEKAKWKGLKNYINDYSLLKEKEAAHITNWEDYMVYAMAFGIADKVEKEIKILYKDGEINELPYYYGYYYFNTSFVSSVNTCYANTQTSSSSSGGYSGGGGGGFGGGGGAF